MIFFIIILLISIGMGFHILHLDNQNNNILESCSPIDNECSETANSCLISKSIAANKENNECIIDEEKKLLHLSRLI